MPEPKMAVKKKTPLSPPHFWLSSGAIPAESGWFVNIDKIVGFLLLLTAWGRK